jgi:hydroxyethylthiazole kinase
MMINTPMQKLQPALLDQICDAWQVLQQQQPLVHIMTNTVASNYVANILLAANASPAMIDNPYEAESFVQIAGALSLNLGTPTTGQVDAMHIAAQTAHSLQKPWVLDPVGYGQVLHWRSAVVDQLMRYQPTILRGNASEIGSLAGKNIASKGVSSTVDSAEVYLQAQSLLEQCQCIAISGEADYIISREYPVIQVSGGSGLQPRVTATGCALGALTAAYSAITSPAIAALSAHVHFAIAGQLAFQQAPQLGRFNVAFIDEIHQMNVETIRQYASFQVLAD